MSAVNTPLRHVLSKSVHRAIREHAQDSPTSPLDLRLSPVIRRSYSDPAHDRKATTKLMADQSFAGPSVKQAAAVPLAIEPKPTFMATIYESAKKFQQLRENQLEGSSGAVDESIATNVDGVDGECPETGEKHNQPAENEGTTTDEVWYTPNEFPAVINYNSSDEVSFFLHGHSPMPLIVTRSLLLLLLGNTDRTSNTTMARSSSIHTLQN